jgi:hypothetical protein
MQIAENRGRNREENVESMNLLSKASIACALASVAVVSAAPRIADAAGASGRWSVTGHGPDGSSVTPVCQIVQSGSRVSGTCIGPNGRGPIAGTISGATISFQWRTTRTTAVGFTGVVALRGVMERDGAVHGTYSFARGSGAFTMRRS